jgi:hypothetical protein
MTHAQELRDRLDVLEAERLVLTIELRNALIRAAKKLLPRAIAQATGSASRRVGPKGTKGAQGTREPRLPPSPALLRLIARLAMRDTRIDRPRKA